MWLQNTIRLTACRRRHPEGTRGDRQHHRHVGDAANLSAIGNLPGQIAALTGDAIHQAAQTYLDLRNYVKVTLMPEVK